jgi:hypothetical protein
MNFREERYPMKFKPHYITLFLGYTLFALVLVSCTFTQSDSQTNTRPACVTLDSYGYVIEQVMSVQPDWELLGQSAENSRYQWMTEDEGGKHTLSTTLTSDGCVCATVASSHFSMGSGKEEMVGLLQGAAVAPISNLDYTATWLEPKVSFSCGAAYLTKGSYDAETVMKDGTTWSLTCSRNSSSSGYDSLYTLTIIAPGCAEILE